MFPTDLDCSGDGCGGLERRVSVCGEKGYRDGKGGIFRAVVVMSE